MDDIRKSGVYAQSLMSIHGFDMDPMVKQKGFTLIEILIVVSILGIMAAIIMPEFHGHTTKAKEAAAKETLQMARGQIGLFKIQHKGLTPGYSNGVLGPEGMILLHFTYCSDINGALTNSKTPTGNFIYGPYMNDYPKNPFNNRHSTLTIDTGNFPEAKGNHGWIYKASTGEIRLDWPGTDSKGTAYYSY